MMTNEQAIEYLIAEGVLSPRARKRKRVRQYAYVAECWRRHLINLEAALQSIEALNTRLEVMNASHEARLAVVMPVEEWRALLAKPGMPNEEEQREIERVVKGVYMR